MRESRQTLSFMEGKNRPRVGLLGLYLELYDNALPDMRGRIDAFYATICEEFQSKGIEVVSTSLCRVASEFQAAIKLFETQRVDAIVTLHLAYSPSLECIESLSLSTIPLIILDTTPAFDYSPHQEATELLYNHGIHGVQDMCNMLIRVGKAFQIEAGHWSESDVIDRVVGWCHAAKISGRMRSARVGLIGESFKGMGDFVVARDTLRNHIGIEVIQADLNQLSAYVPDSNDELVVKEVQADQFDFKTDGLDKDCHVRSVQSCLAIRRWVEQQQLSAISFNFLACDRFSGLPAVPFLEASKGMAKGIGYAGEGDVLTAALVGALASTLGQTTFTEMFCPDWKGDTIFLSHMGEVNPEIIDGSGLLKEMPFPWADAANPAFILGCYKSGVASIVNLAPGPKDTFTLIVAPVTMVAPESQNNQASYICGWFKPQVPVSNFLEAYSRAGGTHHLALVYGDVADQIIRFGALMGWNTLLLNHAAGNL